MNDFPVVDYRNEESNLVQLLDWSRLSDLKVQVTKEAISRLASLYWDGNTEVSLQDNRIGIV